jgi:hypothetical protein
MRLKSKYDWNARKAALMAAEVKRDLRWYYMSFSSEKLGFLGAAIIRAPGPMHAYVWAGRMGISPAGGDFEVGFIEAPVDNIPDAAKNRFLSPHEINRLLGPLVDPATGEEWQDSPEN